MASDTSLSCRACRNPVPGDGPRLLCQHCGYINFRLFDTQHEFAWLTSELSGATVELLFKNRIERVVGLIEKDLERASSLLVELMTIRESLLADKSERSVLREGEAGVFNIAVQLVYLLLCERGGVRLRSLQQPNSPVGELKALENAAFDAAHLATRWLRELNGDATYELKRNALIEHFSEQGNLLLETQENSLAVEQQFRRPEDVFDDAELYAMQKGVLDFSMEDYLSLTRDRFAKLRTLATVRERGPIVAAKLDGGDARTKRLLDFVTLNKRRIEDFRFPYYFDLGTPKTGINASPPFIEKYALNWTSYYPAYAAHVDDLGPASLFTIYTFRNAFAYMSASRSLMASELEKRATRSNSPEAIAVRGFHDKVAARFEERIEDVLRRQGFQTKANVEVLIGAVAREIDVVGAKNCGKTTEIVLIEAKDFDMPLHKGDSLRIAVKDLGRAVEHQLIPLTTWARKEWRSVLQMLGVAPQKRVVLSPLLVTRRYMAPNVVPNGTVVPLRMLECVLARINHKNLKPKDGLGTLPRMVIFPPEEVEAGS
jgi:hypothetical protein